jgi:predicted phage terminase large subunit-like protein
LAEHDRELASRILSRRKLIHFVERFNPGYMAGWVHKDIARRLERFMRRVEEGQSPRLLILMPPRHGKSRLASEAFVAWVFGHHPDWELISSSYNITLPVSFSRRIRSNMRTNAYKGIFPLTELNSESQSVEEWETTAGGVYRAAGVGGGITGKGANIFIVDDPVKNWEDASSATVREGTWDWWLSTAYTRLAPGAGVLGIQTLWHDDDWAGRIMQGMKTGEGEAFEIVQYPAINEGYDEYLCGDEILRVFPGGPPPPPEAVLTRPAGSALHPERYDLDALLRIKSNFAATANLQMWSALYQQNPVPDEGSQFRRDMFRYTPARPDHANMTLYQAWDLSITTKEQNDWIVGTTLAQDFDGNVYEIDVVRFKSEDNLVIADAILDAYDRWKPYVVGIEDGQIWKSIKSTVVRRAKERGTKSLNYEVLVPLTDKIVRAGPLRGRMQLGKVWFWKEAPWRDVVDSELLRFPAGKHDDIVDSLAWCVRLTLNHAPPHRPKLKAPASWKERLAAFVRDHDHGATHMSS